MREPLPSPDALRSGPDAMLCVTGAEPSLAAATARIRALPEGTLGELRLDLLEALPDPRSLPRGDGLIVTLRDRAEGGRFDGAPEEKARLLFAALDAGARYVDLEAAAPDALWRTLSSTFGPERLVASLHVFDGAPAEGLAPLLARLVARPAGVLKLALGVTDVCELAPLRALEVPDRRPLLRIGMGLAGEASRVAYEAMGSPWTYVTAPGAGATAPGQPRLDDLARLGSVRPRLLALLGGAQVACSPGPRVYTRLAREEGLPYVYVPAPTADPLAALGVLGDLGLAGASVTMPHKVAVLGAAVPQGFAARVGAVNTLVPTAAGTWTGHNTDGAGVLGALGPALSGGPRRVAVLGTGGAARAAAFALAEAGHEVRILGRRPAAAQALASELGPPAAGEALAALAALSAQPFDVLVNATPSGAREGESPIPLERPWAGITVLDLLLTPRRTALLAAVARGGGLAVPGLTMWAHQGAAQWRLLTGHAVSPGRLLELAAAEEATP